MNSCLNILEQHIDPPPPRSLLLYVENRLRFIHLYAHRVNVSALYNSGGYRIFYMEAAEWPPLLLSRSDSVNIEAIVWSITPFDGPGARLAGLPNALYQEGSSSLSRPITPPLATPRSPWHGRNRNWKMPPSWPSARRRLRRLCSDHFLTLQHSKLVIFNQIAVGQPLSLLSAQLSTRLDSVSSFFFFKTCSKSAPFCQCTNWDTGELNGSGWSNTVMSIFTEHIMLEDVDHYVSAEPSILRVPQCLSQNRGYFVCQRLRPGPPQPHSASVVRKASPLEELPLSR